MQNREEYSQFDQGRKKPHNHYPEDGLYTPKPDTAPILLETMIVGRQDRLCHLQTVGNCTKIVQICLDVGSMRMAKHSVLVEASTISDQVLYPENLSVWCLHLPPKSFWGQSEIRSHCRVFTTDFSSHYHGVQDGDKVSIKKWFFSYHICSVWAYSSHSLQFFQRDIIPPQRMSCPEKMSLCLGSIPCQNRLAKYAAGNGVRVLWVFLASLTGRKLFE